MYFEDIYITIKPYWKDVFSLENIENTKTYVKDIMNNYNEIEYIVDHKCPSEFSEWESMLVFTMYQTLTAHALKRWKDDKTKEIYFSEIPLKTFEEYFRKNMEPEDEFEGNFEYLKQYKGFRDIKNY